METKLDYQDAGPVNLEPEAEFSGPAAWSGIEPGLASATRFVGVCCWAGLLTGLVELGPIFAKIHFAQNGIYRRSPHVIWMAPVANLLIFGLVGCFLVLFVRPIPRVGSRLCAGLLGMISVFSLLLAVPGLKALAGLALALGVASWGVPAILNRLTGFKRLVRITTPWLVAALLGLTGLAFGKEWLGARRAGPSPVATEGSPNIVLLVMDTVRADATSLYGSARDTTPNLAKFAAQGAIFDRAISTAPWTLPSHASMFTGRWSWELAVGPSRPLQARFPTLAGYLGDHGYSTAGFVANTFLCTREYGLGRGFDHYEDYVLTPLELLRSSSLGWLGCRLAGTAMDRLDSVLGREPKHALELKYERKSAAQINGSALDWVSARGNRPFFLFLNYFDVHDPYLLPAPAKPRFSPDRPVTLAERQTLRDWITEEPRARTAQEMTLARNAYDDCLAYLDDQIGNFLAGLERLGQLKNTIVVITSDHGEHFGEHQRDGLPLIGHRLSVYQPEIHVPLLVEAPGRVPASARVSGAVSLRQVPATLVNLAGLGAGSPFPGGSWFGDQTQSQNGQGAMTQPGQAALSEFTPKTDLISPTPGQPHDSDLMRAVVQDEKSYHRHGDGSEAFFDLKSDPGETQNLFRKEPESPEIQRFQAILPELVPAEILDQGR